MHSYQRLYWDSSVWIALIKGETVSGIDRCEVPRVILEDAEAGKVTIFISRITVVEVHKKKKYPNLTKEEDEKVQLNFFSHEYIKQIDVDRWIANYAHDLAWEYNLNPNDAIHLASAIRVKAEILHHWDGDFGRVPKEIMISETPDKTKWHKQTSFIKNE